MAYLVIGALMLNKGSELGSLSMITASFTEETAWPVATWWTDIGLLRSTPDPRPSNLWFHTRES